MLRCISCSSEAPDGARFCASCGAPLDGTAAPPREPAPRRDSAAPLEATPSRRSALPTEAAAPPSSSDPSSVHGRFLPGTSLGERYRIVGLLGRGGMGEVYRADDLELGESVALKFLPERLAADPSALDRLRGEVRTARQISHPNVCRVYDIAQADGHFFLSMEYVDGDDLSQVLRRLGPPSKDKAVEIARQLCLGLAAAHENNVLHRDLKPANVMLDGRGRVRITDFGLAGLTGELEASPERAGTPAYMAPEQFESGKVSVGSDIYSLGLVLYELFTGKQAFAGETLEELRGSRSSGSVPSMQSQNETVDPTVERVVLRCLEADPADRPPSVYAVLAALPGGDPLAAALAAGETPSPDMVASARERGGLSPRWALALFLGVLVPLGLFATLAPGWTIEPEMGPDELGVLARRMVLDLGHELPQRQAWGLTANSRYIEHRKQEGDGRAWNHDGPHWPPPYFYWHRASPASLQSTNIHSPLTKLGTPLAAPPGSIAIVLGSAGHLVELEVVPAPARDEPEPEAGVADWSMVLEQAGLDPVALEPTAPARDVPPYCNEVVAFRVERPEEEGGDFVFQAGAHRGRIVHATTAWNWHDAGPLARARRGHFRQRDLPAQLFALFWAIVYIVTPLAAWHNVRLGRSDRRGALVYGAVVFAAYLFFDSANARISEFGVGGFLLHIVFSDPIGHAVMHALHTALIYLAIEPYVRRVWPRALIGWARLARGRWKDPAVAREVLIGIAAAQVAGTLLGLGLVIAQSFADRAVTGLFFAPEVLGDSARMATEIPHVLALTMFFMMGIYFLLLILRLLTRRDWATIVLALILAAGLGAIFLGLWEGSVFEIAAGVIAGAFFITVGVVVVLRIGLLAAIAFGFTLMLGPLIPATLDLSAFYAPQAMMGMLVLVALAAYGFRYSLAGHSVLQNVFAGGSPPRAAGR